MIEIDAKNKALGRVASQAAKILMGKNKADFKNHVVKTEGVHIVNASKIKLPAKRIEKEYKRYSGYPGGLKSETMEMIIAKKGYTEIFKKAINGMIPANRLRNERMKNLKITE